MKFKLLKGDFAMCCEDFCQPVYALLLRVHKGLPFQTLQQIAANIFAFMK